MLDKLRGEFTVAQLPEGRFIKDFPNTVLYVGRNRNGDLKDVMVLMLRNGTNLENTVFAPTGKMEVNTSNQVLSVPSAHGPVA